MITRTRVYHNVFEKHYGSQPWECYRCGKEAELIHHIDENPHNNLIENLQPLCDSCHKTHHHTGAIRPAGTGEKIAATKRGKTRDEETKRKISESLTGRKVENRKPAPPISEETRRKRAESVRLSWEKRRDANK